MIYLVTGFMRSGTSMMMQCLEAGGMAAVKNPVRDKLNKAHSDALYRPNPESLYEPTIAEMDDPTFPRAHDGKAVKVVCPMLGKLAVAEYSVIFMRRDAEEIRQSFEGAFGELLTRERIETVVRESLLRLKNRKDVLAVREVWYRDVLNDPTSFFLSLDWPIDSEKAAAAVDPGLCRFHREALVEGL